MKWHISVLALIIFAGNLYAQDPDESVDYAYTPPPYTEIPGVSPEQQEEFRKEHEAFFRKLEKERREMSGDGKPSDAIGSLREGYNMSNYYNWPLRKTPLFPQF